MKTRGSSPCLFIREVNDIIPEKAAAIEAAQRLIPEYQNIKANTVTKTPYHISESPSRKLVLESKVTQKKTEY
jgi:hypothetical protein